MAAPLLVAKNDKTTLQLRPSLANRHGLITGATGIGKSVTLQAVDRESAYEKLTQRTQAKPAEPQQSSNPVSDILFGKLGPRGGKRR